MRGTSCARHVSTAGHVLVDCSACVVAEESVVGALYLDGGLEPAKAFILRDMEDRIRRADRSGHQSNFKSVLQQDSGEFVAYPQNLSLLIKNEIWENSDSEKRKSFLENYFNYGNSVDLLKLIE